MEKLAFTLIIAAQKLKPYFQAPIVVLTDKPLRKAMSSPEATGRMALWVVELSEFDIQYCLRTTVKRQVVVDFITKFTLEMAREQKRKDNGTFIQTDLQIDEPEGQM